MIILGLDQAPVGIGWAYGEPGERPKFGYHENPGYGWNTARLRQHVRDWLTTFLTISSARRVYFEQILVRSHGLDMRVLHQQFAIVGGIETACEMAGLMDECYEVMIADWRREFHARCAKRQSSEAWKLQAKIECARRGWLTDNHNVAEALAIWHYGCLCTDKAGVQRQRERERAGM